MTDSRMHLVDVDLPGPKRDYVGYGRRRPRVVWPNHAKVAVNFVINYEEGSEYSYSAGDNRNVGWFEVYARDGMKQRDLYQESVFEYGSRAGIWRLLRIFDDYSVPITFFACAVALERNPEVGAWIKESKHEACSHGWRLAEQWTLTPEQEREQMQWAIEMIKEQCGVRPYGWYSGMQPSLHTRELLVEEGGFVYDSDSYSDDLPYFVELHEKQHLVVPYSSLVYNDARFIATQGFSTGADFFDICRRALDEYHREGAAGMPSIMSIGLHGRWSGHAGRASALREFIEYAQKKGDVWFARRIDIARHWLAHHTEFSSVESARGR
jgi:peptidoglycan/xylan/chitin deacetylase (PgdA/CDA1 family)